MIPASEALERLRQGNRRFVAERARRGSGQTAGRRAEIADGQEPFAIILGCSDSRVPAELVFDQGLGDLFVIRVAGNIVAPSQVGSVEFAAEQFHTRLVVVLGHTQCGAVTRHAGAAAPPGEQPIDEPQVHRRSDSPGREGCWSTRTARRTDESMVSRAVRANVRASADHLRHGSPVLEQLIQTSGLLVVGAEYSLETGVVDFFDGVPGASR